MKVLLSWLRDFAPFEGDPVALGDELSDLGMAVEDVQLVGEGLDGIVVARVLETRPIPGANKIHQVIVDAGDGEPLEIGCGAFNMAPGDLVPLATIGTVMPNGMEIRRRKMAGVWSNGMLCSARELGLGDDHDGIYLLPRHLEPGTPFAEAMGIERDVLWDLEINPNRPDAMSMAGVARDLAARLGLPFQLPEPTPRTVPADRVSGVTVEILDPDRCGSFEARVLRDVTVGPGDPKMAARLALVGMRSINNVVDVSNYVMLELGQPNHPYDLAKVAGPGFRIRRARDGEVLTTLDDVERTLGAEDLLICDGADQPVGLAGIMGGADSEISEATTDVLLEMAWFEPIGIVRSSRRHKLRSEASARFEKGTDPEVVDLAMRRFAELLGAPLEDGRAVATGQLPERPRVRLRTQRVARLLGTDLGRDRIAAVLEPIGFATTPVGDDLDVQIPSWRYDASTEIDVIEEVARHHGYSQLGKTVPRSPITGRLTQRQLDRRWLRAVLVGRGVTEAMPMPFLAPGELARCGQADDGIRITNPLVAEQSVLRTSLLPGLVGAVAYNWSHRNHGVRLFEIGHVFLRPADPDADLPVEREVLAAVLAGAEAPEAVHLWRVVVEALGVKGIELANAEVPGLHPTRSARLTHGGEPLGALGEVDPAVLDAYGIGERVAYLEVDLTTLLDLPHGDEAWRPFSLFPSSDIDLAFEVDDAVPATAVEDAIRGAGGDLLWSVSLFDVYRGEGVGEGRRSLAYRLRFQAPDRTLTDAEVAELRAQVIAAVEGGLPASLRG
ncbi:MAG TPA: phenylalanine--tRNA ligase subunit beta [Acidimicrobiales bacterium]|nr:phenylalanine--tRNA ligase subunit beta [Acidimicrobiales bacterium]